MEDSGAGCAFRVSQRKLASKSQKPPHRIDPPVTPGASTGEHSRFVAISFHFEGEWSIGTVIAGGLKLTLGQSRDSGRTVELPISHEAREASEPRLTFNPRTAEEGRPCL
ncbi:hypothetical protein KM043_014159 [Ampulex compressa]|nr:hypothetical protein KM043_014159 [Ampulex compressa]